MLRVRDIMSEDVFTLDAQMTIEDAARALADRGITGAPVLTGRSVVGVLSNSDLAHPDRGLGANAKAPVGDVMTPLVFYLRPGEPAVSAVRLMLYEGVHRLVVVRENGELAGIVTSMDVMKALGRGERVDDGTVEVERAHPHADPEMVRAVVGLRLTLEG
jgi:predicted transcriptional regulator